MSASRETLGEGNGRVVVEAGSSKLESGFKALVQADLVLLDGEANGVAHPRGARA